MHFYASGRHRFGTVVVIGSKRYGIEWTAPTSGITRVKRVSRAGARHLHLESEPCEPWYKP